MKILIINDFYSQGGAEVQAHEMFNLFSKNNYEVCMLTFDPKFNTKMLEDNKYNYKRSNSILSKFFNKFFLNIKAYNYIKNIVKKFNPDIIHLHNNLKMTKTVNKCIKNRFVIQTCHDFGFICPKGTCVKDDGTECDGYFIQDCNVCNISKLKHLVKSFEVKANKKWMDKKVFLKLCPSLYLNQKMVNNGFKNCKVFPNLFEIQITDNKLFKDKVNFLYCGVISEEKGITNLVLAFKKLLDEGCGVNLLICGKVKDEFQKKFDELLREAYNIKYLGFKSHEDILKMYSDALCLIVPSLWLENYPNVMLEAILNNTLCIGSNRGGITEILCQNKNLMFSPLSVDEIAEKVLYVYNMSEDEYNEILTKLKFRVLNYNSSSNVLQQFNKEIALIANFN